ncbi:hypothetical protein OF83DRAFT_188745 [Amylostereum chailletii]|nr:hypothetical protein OF83DRAFT_188745 [Amylostereum chailletii]
MAPHLSVLVSRAASPNDSDSNAITPIIIAGIAFASVGFLAVVLWLSIRAYRRSQQQRRAEKRESAFANVKGLVSEKSSPLAISRSNLDGVTMPRPTLSKADILSYHEKTGTLTRAFTPLPAPSTASPATAAAEVAIPQPARSNINPSGTHPPPSRGIRSSPGVGHRPGSSLNPAYSRSSLNPGLALDTRPTSRPISTVSWFAPAPPSPSSNRFSFRSHSRGSSIFSNSSSSGSTMGKGDRKVHQIFEPVLPDELVVRVGERVSVVQTLDDGWCVVGRGALGTGDVEMGVIPAWCFIKPVKGLRAERPMRTASLGVTVQLEPPSSEREQIISWSNF